MPTNVLMPALSPTMTEGNLVKWNVKQGDTVRAGDVIAEIETDKATMEVEAVDEGVVDKIVVPEGAQGVQVNAVIAVIVGDGEEADRSGEEAPKTTAPAAAKDQPGAEQTDAGQADEKTSAKPASESSTKTSDANLDSRATPLAARMARQAGIELDSLNGTGPHGKITKSDIEGALGGRDGEKSASEGRVVDDRSAGDGARIFASPLARRMAGDADISLDSIEGSGPQGRIVASDVEAAKNRPRPAPQAKQTASKAQEKPAETPASVGKPPPSDIPGMPAYDLVPHTSIRKVIARRLTESKQTVPHFYLTVDCDVDQLLRMRKEVNEQAGEGGVKISVNDFVIKAIALALRKVPDANASWSDEGIRRWQSVDISVAVAIPAGLITPIVRNADQKGLATISTEMRDLAKRARDGKLKPEEFQGGTCSISNLGMYGIRQFDAVINPPQACILAIGASEQRPVVKSGQLAVATMMTCTLSCDHRVVDGALGAQLLTAFKLLIERPAMMLL